LTIGRTVEVAELTGVIVHDPQRVIQIFGFDNDQAWAEDLLSAT
jgi:hypothetical protein